MHRETKATSIPAAVKKAVFERDASRCVLCGDHKAGPHCHIVRRAQGGLGIEQNIFTGCDKCHREFDSEGNDGALHKEIRNYMKGWYVGWDEADLVYKKYGGSF